MCSSYREFDHTGDLGIEVEAESLGALFEEAALGMFALLTDPSSVKGVRSAEISVTAPDRVELLQKWLAELNYLHLTDRVLVGRVRVTHISDHRLHAVVYVEPIDKRRHAIQTEIKAVTYHELVVERRNDCWHARIIFDI